MLSHTKYLTMKVPERMDFVNITGEVEKAVKESRVREGLCLVNAMHITASVFINDDEPGLHEDYKRWLEWLAPYDPSPERYHHNRTGEDNGDAHHKRQVMGREVVVAITDGKLDFGPWEQIFYGEFDGRRPKRILIKGDWRVASDPSPVISRERLGEGSGPHVGGRAYQPSN
jgi:secondary thiamine-phosphate synthase enzyme